MCGDKFVCLGKELGYMRSENTHTVRTYIGYISKNTSTLLSLSITETHPFMCVYVFVRALWKGHLKLCEHK